MAELRGGKRHNLIIRNVVDMERVLRQDSVHGGAVVGLKHNHTAFSWRLRPGGDEVTGRVMFGQKCTMRLEEAVNLLQWLLISQNGDKHDLAGYDLFLFGFGKREAVPKRLYDFECLAAVVNVKDVSLFGAGIGRAAFGIGHQVGKAGQLLDIRRVVASRDDAFLIQVNHIIPHHLAAAGLAERCQHIAYISNEVG